MAKDKNGLFRKVSLDRLSSPDKLDQLVKVTSPKGWLALLGILFILLVSVIWGIYGSVSTKIRGMGMLIKSGGIIKIEHNTSGYLTDIRIKEGDIVKKGDTIARMSSPSTIKTINNAQFDLKNLEERETRLKEFYSQSNETQKRYYEEEKENKLAKAKGVDIKLKELTKKVIIEEELYKKGGISRDQLTSTQEAIRSLQIEKEDIDNEIKKLDLQKLSTEQEKGQNLIDLKNQIEEKKSFIDYLQQKLETETRIVTPYSGRIIEVLTHKDALVNAGESIATIELTDNMLKNLEAVVFVSALEGKQIKSGMDVQLTPSNVKAEEYGVLLGKVTYVSDYPVTRKYVEKIFSSEVAEIFFRQGAPVEVRVDLIPDSKTESGYKWSSRQGPPMLLQTGTSCEGQVTVKRERPISLVIPIFKRSLGLN